MHSVPQRTKKDDRRSRYEQYGEGHFYTCLPDTEGFDWLVSAWMECGKCKKLSMGDIDPLPWQEIESYDRSTGETLGVWARSVLREMSEAYVKWIGKGSQQGDIADDVPYINRTEETMKAASAHLMRNRDKAHEKQESL